MLNRLNHFLKILKFKLNFLAEMSMKKRKPALNMADKLKGEDFDSL